MAETVSGSYAPDAKGDVEFFTVAAHCSSVAPATRYHTAAKPKAQLTE